MKQAPRGHRAGRLSGFCTGGGRRMRPPPVAVPEGRLGFYVCRRAKPAAWFLCFGQCPYLFGNDMPAVSRCIRSSPRLP